MAAANIKRTGWKSEFHRRWKRLQTGLLAVADDHARQRSSGFFGLVFVLTLSLAMDVIAGVGFVPLQMMGVDYLGFVIHELGHLVFRLAGTTLSVMMGTGFQWLLPAGAIWMFLKQRDGAAACYAVCWLAASLNDSVDYIADARTQQGDLTLSLRFWSMVDGREVGAEETIHDWNYMLGGLGLLQWDHWIAGAVRATSIMLAIAACVAVGYLFWRSMVPRRKKRRGGRKARVVV